MENPVNDDNTLHRNTEEIERPADRDSDGRATVSFSVRLTEKQKELLEQAAKIRGWTMTSLLKNAALEKAGHIINTSTTTNLDFKGLARKIADQVFAERTCRVADWKAQQLVEGYALEDISGLPDWVGIENPVQVWPWKMTSGFLDELRRATRYGGVEFLSLVLDASEEITNRNQSHLLPAPIDPSMV